MKYLSNASSGSVVGGDNLPGTNTTRLWYPHGIFFDSSTNSLLIAIAGANNVVRWILGGTQSKIVVGNTNGSAGSTSSLLNIPTDVMLDPLGNMYVLDRYNYRVQFFCLANRMVGQLRVLREELVAMQHYLILLLH